MAGSGGASRQNKHITLKARKNVFGKGVSFSEGNQYIFRTPKPVSEGRAVAIAGSRVVDAMKTVARHERQGRAYYANAQASKSGWSGNGPSERVRIEMGPGKNRIKRRQKP